MDVEGGRVDDHVGALAHGSQTLPLEVDAVEDRAVALKRMRAAHGFEAADEHVVRRVEEHDPHRTAAAQRPGDLGQLGEQVAPAHVDDDGDARKRAGGESR